MRRLLILCLVGVQFAILPAPASGSGDVPRIRLVVRVDLGTGAWERWTLQCSPTGGTHPNRSSACRLLLNQGRSVLAPVPTGTVCTMLFGGPERATVRGTWNEKPVRASFSRRDGCESARWDRARALFTTPGRFVVRGDVSLSPTCAAQQAGDACEDPSVDARVIFTRGSTRVIATAVKERGFAVRLRPGTWMVTADAGMSCPTVEIRVPTERVLVACDTGIR